MQGTAKLKLKSSKKKISKPTIGWREWCSLPYLGIAKIKCKVDTGAKTSSLHAYDVEVIKRHGLEYVSFKVHPLQRDTKRVEHCLARLQEWRQVTDSGGKRTLRPVILSTLKLGSVVKEIEFTLIARDEMGFRMLLGREALKKTWLVDPSKSFILSKKSKTKLK
ncbi:MAG: RimK/LysX family protein [Proteobacteria bacterium]|nr:RimK/LysX family protein [Pseudomonadota bacterium]